MFTPEQKTAAKQLVKNTAQRTASVAKTGARKVASFAKAGAKFVGNVACGGLARLGVEISYR
jgi:hypothetical protein